MLVGRSVLRLALRPASSIRRPANLQPLHRLGLPRPVLMPRVDLPHQLTRMNSTSSPKQAEAKEKAELKKEISKEGVVPPPEEAKKMTLWQKVKHEVQHYWDGTKLLGYEIKVSTKLAAKMAAGYDLTRREDRQLRRTTQDIVRLIPFSMFVIVPFAELLLPIVLRIFPNFLPSTYESRSDKEKKTKKLRKTRGNVSTFLRQTVSESGMVFPVHVKPEQREQFAKFARQVRTSGENPSKELLVSVARCFKDDIVLDNLSRPQLVALAKYLNLQPFGTDVMLRYGIRYKLRQVRRDDAAIEYEGVESLSTLELQAACSSRGIKTYSVSPAKLRDDLSNWLELRLQQKVPSTLLLLSSAYTYGSDSGADNYYDGLLAVLSALPEELYHEAELELAPKEATNKQRLEVIKEQEELIKDENEQEDESGHVIKVRDNINIDDEPKAVPENEADKDITPQELEKETAGRFMSLGPQDSTETTPTPFEMEEREEAFKSKSPKELEKETAGRFMSLGPQDSTETTPTPFEMEEREEAFNSLSPKGLQKASSGRFMNLGPQDSSETTPTPFELEGRDKAFESKSPKELEKETSGRFMNLGPQDSSETTPTPFENEQRERAYKSMSPKELERETSGRFMDLGPQDSSETTPTPFELEERERAFKSRSPEELQKETSGRFMDLGPQDSTETTPTPFEMEEREEAFNSMSPQQLEKMTTPKTLAKDTAGKDAHLHQGPQDSLENDPSDAELRAREKAFSKSPRELAKETAGKSSHLGPQDSLENDPSDAELRARENAFSKSPRELAKETAGKSSHLGPQDSLENDPSDAELRARENAFSKSPRELAKETAGKISHLGPQDSSETDPNPAELKSRDETLGRSARS